MLVAEKCEGGPTLRRAGGVGTACMLYMRISYRGHSLF